MCSTCRDLQNAHVMYFAYPFSYHTFFFNKFFFSFLWLLFLLVFLVRSTNHNTQNEPSNLKLDLNPLAHLLTTTTTAAADTRTIIVTIFLRWLCLWFPRYAFCAHSLNLFVRQLQLRTPADNIIHVKIL